MSSRSSSISSDERGNIGPDLHVDDEEDQHLSQEEDHLNNLIGVVPEINFMGDDGEVEDSHEKSDSSSNQPIQSLTAMMDNWSLGAQRLYRTISNHSNPQQCLKQLLEEANSGKDLSQSELFQQIKDDQVIEGKEEENIRRSASVESEEELTVANQMDAVFRLINRGVAPAGVTLNVLLDPNSIQTRIDSFIDWSLAKLQLQGKSVLRGFLPIQHMQTMLLVCVVQMITVNRILNLVPIFTAYVAFFGMAYSTLSMFHSRHVMKETEVWNRLLTAFEPKNVTKTASPDRETSPMTALDSKKSFYKVKSMDTYINFFTFLLVFVLSFAVSGGFVPNCMLLCLMACFLSALCFVALPDKLDSYAAYALVLCVISSLPLLFKKFGWSLCWWLRPLGVMRLGYFQLSLSIPSLAYIGVPVLYCIMASGLKWQQIAKVQVPHIVCLMWAEVAMLLFVPAPLELSLTSLGLTLALISLIMWPTGVGLFLVLAMAVAQLKDSFSLLNLLKVGVTIGLLLLPFVYGRVKTLFLRHYKEYRGVLGDSQQNRRRSLILMGFYVCLVFMCVALFYHGSNKNMAHYKDITNLSWSNFEESCGSSSRPVNDVERQIICSQLKGTAVTWKGAVHQVRIVKIDNSLENLLEYLPSALAQFTRCFYGVRETKWGLGPEKVCSLNAQHWYTFELEVNGPWGENVLSTKGSVVLTAGHVFLPILRHLQEGDVVKFAAQFDLFPAVRWNPPRLRLLRLECKTCKAVMDKQSSTVDHHSVFSVDKPSNVIPRIVEDYSISSNFWSRIFSAFKFLFNFLFAPFITVR